MAEATNDSVIISAITDLPDEVEFNLPVDSAKALLKFKSPITGLAVSEQAVKFCFKDGSSLTSLVLTEQMIESARFYAGEWGALNLRDTTDLLSLSCDRITFENGNATYVREHSKGVIEGVADPTVAVTVGKEPLDRLLRVSSDIRLSDDGFRLMAVADTCRAICATRAHPNA
jgi:hypothetical protein